METLIMVLLDGNKLGGVSTWVDQWRNKICLKEGLYKYGGGLVTYCNQGKLQLFLCLSVIF